MSQTKTQKIEEILNKGVDKVILRNHLEKRLKSGEKLRIKFGIDPTSSDIHLGNAVILWKLREFQKLGHKIILIIGDFTAQIGDPSGRSGERRTLTKEEVAKNMKTYKKQIGEILDFKKIELIYNSRHLLKLNFSEIYRLLHFFSVNQILERDIFQERKRKEKPIWLHEFLYPILQAYDSVVVKADIEIGGKDQLFNMIMGRQLQPHFGQLPQDIITMKLLIGTDGRRKMSKSFGNYIGINESAKQQYGKLMSINDELIPEYFELCTPLPLEEVNKIKSELKNKKVNPRDLKEKLARTIVSIYHGVAAAKKAEKEFVRIFKEKKTPTKIPEIRIQQKNINILDLLVKIRFASSKSEAKRLISQGGIKIDAKVCQDWGKVIEVQKGMIIQVGKRRFVRII